MFGYVQCYEIIPCDYLLMFTVETFCPPVRLVGGRNGNEGRVDIYYNNTWGTVCWNGWDRYDSNTLCRQLGFPEAELYFRYHFPDQENAPIWIDQVKCDDFMTCLGKCPSSGFGNNKCQHQQDVFVRCQGTRNTNEIGNELVGYIETCYV